MFSELEQYFQGPGKSVFDSIVTFGLQMFTTASLSDSRVLGALLNYQANLIQRPHNETNQNFFHLLYVMNSLKLNQNRYLTSEIIHEFLEDSWRHRRSPLSDENITVLKSHMASIQVELPTMKNVTVIQVHESVAQIIAADALWSNFELRQSFGLVLAKALPEIFGESLNLGFSKYSSEECHESLHGNGTCTHFLAREGQCQG